MKKKLRNLLKNLPFAEKILRRTYLLAKYLIKGDLNFRYQVHSAKLISIEPEPRNVAFFGYYDKSPWSPNGEYYLIHQLDKSGCSIVLKDLENNAFKTIGETSSWNYQQGAMLQWLPSSSGRKLIYNCISKNILGSRIHDVIDSTSHFFPWPIQTIHPNGKRALSINYCRLRVVNSEYGYTGNYQNLHENLSDEHDGLWSFSIENSRSKLLVSIKKLIRFKNRNSMENAMHCINHVMYSPSGENIIFIHRWVTKDHIRYSRLYLLNEKSNELKILLDDDFVSHYCWIDNSTVFTYSGTKENGPAYYLIDINVNTIEHYNNAELNYYGDGHPGISPDGNWIITDTYPDGRRIRKLLLVDLRNDKVYGVGKFYAPVSFEDAKRCDLHPRWHPSKPEISIDSAHDGVRKNYIVNVEMITGKFNVK